MNNTYRDQFLMASNDWVCEACSIDIRYVAKKNGDKQQLLTASIVVAPLPSTVDMSFSLETSEICAGQIQLSGLSKYKLLEILNRAVKGKLEINGLSLQLFCDSEYDYHSDLSHSDIWFTELKLQVIGSRDATLPLSHIDACKVDDALRKCSPPFDGLADLTGWLGLKNPLLSHECPSIIISVLPPVDIDFVESNLDKDVLNLHLNSHPNFDLSSLTVAIRAVPGTGLKSRKQVTSEFKWKSASKGVRKGAARIRLVNADSALAMFVIGDITVRRQWFLDPTKSSNSRLVTVQHFDKELRKIKAALFESTDSARFELGVAALLFLLGFSSSVQLEDDSPDIVVTTPGIPLFIPPNKSNDSNLISTPFLSTIYIRNTLTPIKLTFSPVSTCLTCKFTRKYSLWYLLAYTNNSPTVVHRPFFFLEITACF